MQIISRTFNDNVGKIIETKNHNSNEDYVHEVKISKNSKLYEIIQKEIIKVNSRHNTYIPFTDLDKVAYSVKENIIEAVEDESKRFFMGIQWHPETLLEDENSKKIFDAYIESL